MFNKFINRVFGDQKVFVIVYTNAPREKIIKAYDRRYFAEVDRNWFQYDGQYCKVACEIRETTRRELFKTHPFLLIRDMIFS